MKYSYLSLVLVVLCLTNTQAVFAKTPSLNVLCADIKGNIVARTKCKKKETQVTLDLLTAQGVSGPQGPIGEKGEKGDQGPAGSPGVGGVSTSNCKIKEVVVNDVYTQANFFKSDREAFCDAGEYAMFIKKERIFDWSEDYTCRGATPGPDSFQVKNRNIASVSSSLALINHGNQGGFPDGITEKAQDFYSEADQWCIDDDNKIVMTGSFTVTYRYYLTCCKIGN